MIDFARVLRAAEQCNSLFRDKGALSAIGPGGELVGRHDKVEELVCHLAGSLPAGYASPFVFVYGRTGSGKSTVVRLVCEGLRPQADFCEVNLRDACTAFTAACLILEALGGAPEKKNRWRPLSSQSILDDVERALLDVSAAGRLFVLVLDEFDSLMSDTRGRPSDFMYKLVKVIHALRTRGRLVSVVAIMNDFLAPSAFGERVSSRLGASPEVFFEPYGKDEVLEILRERAARAFLSPDAAPEEVLEFIAEQSSLEHGDSRRAIDLLRVAGEMAGEGGNARITREHAQRALARLQRDRVDAAISRASLQTFFACGALLRLSTLLQGRGDGWFAMSDLYDQYRYRVVKRQGPVVQYRRFAEIMEELEALGIVTSKRKGAPRDSARSSSSRCLHSSWARCPGTPAGTQRWWTGELSTNRP